MPKVRVLGNQKPLVGRQARKKTSQLGVELINFLKILININFQIFYRRQLGETSSDSLGHRFYFFGARPDMRIYLREVRTF